MHQRTDIASVALVQPESGLRHATPDEQQLEALRQRNPAAWTQLFEQHNGLVFRSALAQLGDRALAEDITAQVFLEAIEGIGRYRSRGKPLTAWLLSIARHRSIDAARKRARQTTIPTIEHIPGIPLPGGEALEALAELTPDQRQVIHLRFIEDLSIEQVAALTNRTQGAVKSLQHRALRQLRARLDSTTTTPGGATHA
jgi:RNA polymerase sigma-70 factor, ECF subfamily